MTINCVIIDDEQPAREVLINYIGKLPSLRLLGAFPEALSALPILQFERVDLLFLDIQMPELTGVQLMKTLSHPPHVIFTTAFSEYAVEGFDLGATDYLLKPFSFERFLKAVSRVLATDTRHMLPNLAPFSVPTIEAKEKTVYKSSLFLKADKVIHRVAVGDLLFLTSLGNYTKVYAAEQMLVVHDSLSSFEELLDPAAFMRVHKSYLVALEKIKRVEGNRLFIQEHEIPIGEAFRRELQARLSL